MENGRRIVVLTEEEREALLSLARWQNPVSEAGVDAEVAKAAIGKLEGDRMAMLRVPEVAELVGYTAHTIYRKVDQGEIPHRRLGGEQGPIRFHPDDVMDWIGGSR